MGAARSALLAQLAREDEERRPYVCPGCQAFGGEKHAPSCIDGAIEREQEARDFEDDDDASAAPHGADEGSE